MAATDDADALSRLAAAHGVAMSYEGSDREIVTVDPDIVVAVLARLDVDAGSAESMQRELQLVEARSPLPATIAVTEGSGRQLGVAGQLLLEDGTTLDIDGELPADLPLGWHRLVAGDREITVVVAPARMPEVPRTWGWMLQLYALRSAESWGMGDYGDLAEMARTGRHRAGRRRPAGQPGAGVHAISAARAVAVLAGEPPVRQPALPAGDRHRRIAAGADGADVRAEIDALAPDRASRTIDYDAVWAAKLAALELLWADREPS